MAVADSVSIRAESDSDLDAIHGVVAQAFGGDLEAQLVHKIRASHEYVAELALVAIADGRVVGHVMVSHCGLDDDGTNHEIATLSPVSVRPDRQGDGIGSAIIREVIARGTLGASRSSSWRATRSITRDRLPAGSRAGHHDPSSGLGATRGRDGAAARYVPSRLARTRCDSAAFDDVTTD